MGRKFWKWICVVGTACSLLSAAAQAANYPPKLFLLNAHLGYETVSPTELNSRVSNLANINGLIASRLRVERGLLYPDWSHWLEVGFFINEVYNRDLVSGVDSDLRQSLWYLSVIPFGASWWFLKTAFVDFGLSFGLGGALAMNYASSVTPVASGTTTSGQFSTPFAPIVDAKVQARLWFAKYWAIDGAAGVRFLSTTLKDSSGSSVAANLLSMSIVVGASYAFGGYKGVGRTYSEVLKAGAAQAPSVPTEREREPEPIAPAIKLPVKRGTVR